MANRAIKIIGKLGIERSAELLHSYYSGCGTRNLPPAIGYAYSHSTFYRYVHTLTVFVYEKIDANLYGGKINHTDLRLNFGKQWEADGKVIPVTPSFTGEIYRLTKKHGRLVPKLLLNDVIDIKTRFCLAAEPGGRGAVGDHERAYLKALGRSGFPPDVLFVDGEQSEALAAAHGLSKRTAVIVKQKVGEKSQLNTVEGLHWLMDRKLLAGIHSPKWLSLLWGVWMHFNFAEPKETLDGLTPFEAAAGVKIFAGGWRWLLEYSLLAQKKERALVQNIEPNLMRLDLFFGLGKGK